MADITASMVKELREKTGAGMMDCKKALGECDGDVEAAVDWLRTKGLAAAAKKAGRVASEGLVAVATSGTAGAIVEINSETDFLARNEVFQEFVKEVASIALTTGGELAKTLDAPMGSGKSIADGVTDVIASVGENMTFRRSHALSVSDGVVASYVHSPVAPGLGRIGVLVALESGADKTALAEFGRQLAMHVAAAMPQWVDIDEVSADDLERERTVLAEQARESGKPEEIIEKMVEGRLRKFYEETVLLQQTYVIDGETSVAKIVEQRAKELGSPIRIAGMARFVLGEGVEKDEADFAAEVAATLES